MKKDSEATSPDPMQPAADAYEMQAKELAARAARKSQERTTNTGSQTPEDEEQWKKLFKQCYPNLGIAEPDDPIYSLGYMIGQTRLPNSPKASTKKTTKD